jgi:heme/copper-type cytochrome/quinol oxidase subunit 4
MAGLIWADTDNGLFVFVLLTILGGAAAMASGRALAKTWSPAWMILPYMAVLSAAVRFLHFSLFQEELSSIHYYLVTLVILLVVAWLSYRSMRATQMATQYSWSYEKSGWNWRAR